MKENTISGAIQISRPANVFIAALSIFIAILLTGTIQPIIKVIFACISGSMIMAGSNTINDYFDLEIDKINKPNRPLVKGKISPNFTYRLAVIEFILGILISILIGKLAFIIVVFTSLLLILYSRYLKQLPLIGNLVVSFSSGMAFIFGGVAVNRVRWTIVPAILAFFYHLGREMIKDVQDMKGDAQMNAKTFPLIFGKTNSLILITLYILLMLIILPLPYVYHWYNINYLMTAVIGIYPVLIYSIISMWKRPTPHNLGIISKVLKMDMLVGLLALYLG